MGNSVKEDFCTPHPPLPPPPRKFCKKSGKTPTITTSLVEFGETKISHFLQSNCQKNDDFTLKIKKS